jgi:hypothetical protein
METGTRALSDSHPVPAHFNEIGAEGVAPMVPGAWLLWHPQPGFLDIVVNEVRLGRFQRFGRGSFGPRSKP